MDHRRHLLDVAYRLLGSVSEAEDMVQEDYARLPVANLESIDDVRAWLTTADANTRRPDRWFSGHRRRGRPTPAALWVLLRLLGIGRFLSLRPVGTD